MRYKVLFMYINPIYLVMVTQYKSYTGKRTSLYSDCFRFELKLKRTSNKGIIETICHIYIVYVKQHHYGHQREHKVSCFINQTRSYYTGVLSYRCERVYP